jgi:D-glycero-alpha-D-manno-heptose 1-phosphate guanylyltransferase
MDDFHHIEASILAGGAGTRLRTVLSDRSKVMAPVAGRPFLTYLLDQLSAYGIRKVVLCTGQFGDQLRAYLGDTYAGMSLFYSHEQTPLGTAGALARALPSVFSRTLLVMNGDSFFATDLAASLRLHRAKGAQASLLLAYVEDGSRYGKVQLEEDGTVREFREKDSATSSAWINSGIYWFERPVLEALPQHQPLSLEKEVLPGLIGRGLYGYKQRGKFLDIGIPQDYARAPQFFLDLNEPVSAPAL